MKTAAILTQVLALFCLAGAFVMHNATWDTGARMQKNVDRLFDARETKASVADMTQEIFSLRYTGIKSLHIQLSLGGLCLAGTAVFSATSLVLTLVSNVRDARKAAADGPGGQAAES